MLFDVEHMEKTTSIVEKLEKKLWCAKKKLQKAERRVIVLEEAFSDAEDQRDSLLEAVESIQLEVENIRNPNRNAMVPELSWLEPPRESRSSLPPQLVWME